MEAVSLAPGNRSARRMRPSNTQEAARVPAEQDCELRASAASYNRLG